MKRREFTSMLVSIPVLTSVSELAFAKWQGPSQTPSPLKAYLRTNWSQDPFSFGSYSYLAAGSGNEDRETLLQPIGDQVYFSGEALNPNYQSSVHAAYESGQAAVTAILANKCKKIAIIGAGISGIGAAHTLSTNGKEVVVFEGRDRIGGRIWSDRSLGVSVDLGASWIHTPDGNPISALADKGNLARMETGDDRIIRGEDGRKIWDLFSPGWLSDIAEQIPMATENDKINKTELFMQFLEHGFGYEGQDVIFTNGYDQIFDSLRGDYEIRLSHNVDRVMHDSTGVKIGVENKALEDFDAVLVTVPLGVLKKQLIKFEPALSSEKQQAIARMGMGTLDKLYLLFEEPFWDKDVTTILTPENGLPQGHFNFWLNFHKYLNTPIIMAFNAGKYAQALSVKSDEELVIDALQTLTGAYPR